MPTFLEVQFKDKDQAKALGARWDGTAKKWYVPAGKELAPFNAWLPAALRGAAQAPAASSSALMPADGFGKDATTSQEGHDTLATAGRGCPGCGTCFQIRCLDNGRGR